MTLPFVGLLVLGLVLLVRGLMTVPQARAAWLARSVAGTANVIACRSIPRAEPGRFATFTIQVRYTDAAGQSRTAELPASQEFAPGAPIDIRFDPKRPAIVHLGEEFEETNLPIALIVFGGLLMVVSFAYVRD
jgi:hypothetical protein